MAHSGGGLTNERPRTDHVITGQMRGLKKIAWETYFLRTRWWDIDINRKGSKQKKFQRNLGCPLLSVLYDIHTSSNLWIKSQLKLKHIIHPSKSAWYRSYRIDRGGVSAFPLFFLVKQKKLYWERGYQVSIDKKIKNKKIRGRGFPILHVWWVI